MNNKQLQKAIQITEEIKELQKTWDQIPTCKSEVRSILITYVDEDDIVHSIDISNKIGKELLDEYISDLLTKINSKISILKDQFNKI